MPVDGGRPGLTCPATGGRPAAAALRRRVNAGRAGRSGCGKVCAPVIEVAVDELDDLSRVFHLEDGADAAGVILSREQSGLQQRVVLGDDAVSGAETLRQHPGNTLVE